MGPHSAMVKAWSHEEPCGLFRSGMIRIIGTGSQNQESIQYEPATKKLTYEKLQPDYRC